MLELDRVIGAPSAGMGCRGTALPSWRLVLHGGWTFSCAAAGARLRLYASFQHGGAAVDRIPGVCGRACGHLDDPAVRPLPQPTTRSHRGPHLWARVATRL